MVQYIKSIGGILYMLEFKCSVCNKTFKSESIFADKCPDCLKGVHVCERCKSSFKAVNKREKFCPSCKEIIKKEAEEKRIAGLNRPCTKDTEFLISIYFHNGETLKQIAHDLNRSKENVRGILDEAKSSGRYDMHVARYEDYQNTKL